MWALLQPHLFRPYAYQHVQGAAGSTRVWRAVLQGAETVRI
jgi:hypothetical protein